MIERIRTVDLEPYEDSTYCNIFGILNLFRCFGWFRTIQAAKQHSRRRAAMASSGGALRVLLVLLPLSVFCLWIAMRHSTQKAHYKVLGVRDNAQADEIYTAYEHLMKTLEPEKEHGKIQEVQRAFHVLSNELRRRDYDHFGLDELQQGGQNQSMPTGSKPSVTTSLSIENFKSVLESEKPWLIQIYSVASVKSSDFFPLWERIAQVLEGQVNLGRVELGEIELATLLAERNWATGHSTFRGGVPAIIAFPPGCKRLDCLVRYSKELTYESIIDWTATQILNLPRILYYSAQNLIPEFIQKSGPHKVKVIIFSETGERAVPYMRQAAKDYREYADFGCILWRQNEAFLWKSRLGVESPPALVFIKDPGVQPLIFHGYMNRTMFMQLMEEHKHHVLPQLRSITAGELGCDVAGYSAAGKDVSTWYCVIAAGKPGYRLDQLRSTMRIVQDEIGSEEIAETEFVAAATAYKEKRLSLAWLDGEAQKKFCYYFLPSETVHDTCGPRQYAEEEDVPKIFLIRFRREAEKEQAVNTEKPKHLWQQVYLPEDKLASILVAGYNGTIDEVSEVLSWISNTVHDGDTQDIPYFTLKTAPVLVPEESPPMLAATRELASQTGRKARENGRSFMLGLLDLAKDLKLSSMVVLIVSLYVMGWWFQTSRRTQSEPIVVAPNTLSESRDDSQVATDADASSGEGLRRRKD